MTFGELDRRANQAGRSLPVTLGERVVVWSATNLDVLPLFVATVYLLARDIRHPSRQV